MKCLAFIVLSLALLGQSAYAATVYQQLNLTGTVNVNGNALAELGDDVTLAGTERNVTDITIGTRYFFDAGHLAYTGPITLSLYDSTTPGTNGTGHLIASSIAPVAFAGISGSQDQDVTFLFPGTLVPNSFYLSISQNVFDNNFALVYDGNPTIGSTVAAEFVRVQSSTDFFAFNIGGVTGLKATINAVPEPGTLLLASLGAIGLVLAARRRRD